MSCPVTDTENHIAHPALDHGFRIECLEQVMRDVALQFDQISKEMVDLKKLVAINQETLKIALASIAKLAGLTIDEPTKH